MFTLAGDTPEAAATEAASVLRIETALAQGSMARVEMRDPAKRYHIMTIAEVQALSPAFNWSQFLAGLKLSLRPHPQRLLARLRQDRQHCPRDRRHRRTQELPPLARHPRRRPLPLQVLRRRNFNFFAATLAARRARPPLEALHPA